MFLRALRSADQALRLRGTRPAVPVFDPHDVIELGRRLLDDVAVLDARHAVERARCDVEDVARLHLDLAQLAVLVLGPRLEEEAAGLQHDRLVLYAVVLEGQALALAQVQELADVAIGARPPELVTPRLLDALRTLRHLGSL